MLYSYIPRDENDIYLYLLYFLSLLCWCKKKQPKPAKRNSTTDSCTLHLNCL